MALNIKVSQMKSQCNVTLIIELATGTLFSHNVSVKRQKLQAVRETVQLTFHILLVAFVGIVVADTFTHGSIRYRYINLDYALIAVLFLGGALLALEVFRNKS